uniref:'chromo' domain containing protein n=1 Tax=Solanum tuberosum TaxID=4113 RepID=M1DEL7_SOLTU
MVNTGCNNVRPVAPVNAPVEEFATRGRGQGRGRSRERVSSTKEGVPVENAPRNEAPTMHHEEIEENINVENVEEVLQEKEVQAETICIPLIDQVLAQQIMSFLKGLVGPGVLSSVQAPQATANPPIVITVCNVGGTGGIDSFFRPLLGSVMTGDTGKYIGGAIINEGIGESALVKASENPSLVKESENPLLLTALDGSVQISPMSATP